MPLLSPCPVRRRDDDLPASDTKRWHVNRKAEVVLGVRHGVISIEEACRHYRLSIEEFGSWQRLIDEYGLLGLRATYVKLYISGARARRRRADASTTLALDDLEQIGVDWNRRRRSQSTA